MTRRCLDVAAQLALVPPIVVGCVAVGTALGLVVGLGLAYETWHGVRRPREAVGASQSVG